MDTRLTDKEIRALETIKLFIKENGYAPSVRELGEKLGYTSPATTQVFIRNLTNKGYINKSNLKSRTMTLTNKKIELKPKKQFSDRKPYQQWYWLNILRFRRKRVR